MTVDKMEFKAETKKLLDLMIHSLYSHKEIFLRELISNASDAIDKARYESIFNSALLEGEEEWKIKISVNKEAGTLTVSDNGIGLDKESAISELGTIAHSGTKEFLAALKSKEVSNNPDMIGQFGVGFYSAFMVADKVTLISRKAGSKPESAVKWESGADGTYTIEEVMKQTKGTDVTLHLKEDDKNFLNEWEIRSTVKKYSDFIEHPIVMDIEKEVDSTIKDGEKIKTVEEEILNSMKALWLKDRSEIEESEYNEFYKHISHDFTDPSKVIHYKAEGTSEFSSLLFIPSKRPFDMFNRETKTGPTLYVKRVKIMDNCEELIPQYLRFVKGLVDSSDLPLNVSRELLQKNKQMETIKKSITKKVLQTLADIKKNDFDKYLEFYKEFGTILKEGAYFDYSKKETVADLLLFRSTAVEDDNYRTIPEYVENMEEKQEEILYIVSPSKEEALNSPYLETYKAKGLEVLIMTDEVDDIIFNNFEYKGKKFKSVAKGEVELDESEKETKKEAEKKYKKLLNLAKDHLKDDVKEVRLSGRLKNSACCLVGDENSLDPQMEQIMKSMGQEVPSSKRILEINPTHTLFEKMNLLFDKDKKSPVLKDYIDLLYDQALLLEGSKPKDPAEFARRITSLMVDGIEVADKEK